MMAECQATEHGLIEMKIKKEYRGRSGRTYGTRENELERRDVKHIDNRRKGLPEVRRDDKTSRVMYLSWVNNEVCAPVPCFAIDPN